MKNFNFNVPTEIIYGCDSIYKLRSVIKNDVKNILIVTDENAFIRSGAREKILDQLSDFRIEVIDNIDENPSLESIIEGADLALANNSNLIIGIGGGSPMDAAKGIAALATNSGDIIDYINGKSLLMDPLNIICVPTTSGTGSEVTPYAVFTDVGKEKKLCLTSTKIFPKHAIIDPQLTYSMPKDIIINTGVDVLTHAIEAYLSKLSFPLNDLLAVQSINIVLENLEVAIKKETEAMDNMAYASMLSGIAIAHASTILLHVMAYPLTVYHNIPHGKANAILLPAFVEFMNRKSKSSKKVGKIIRMFKKFGGVEKYILGLNIPTKLSFYNISMKEIEKFAEDVIGKEDISITPAEVSKQDIIEIYQSTH